MKSILKQKQKMENEYRELEKQFEAGEEQYNDLVEEKEKLQEQLSSNILQFENQQKEDIINKIREYLTSYESISEIEGLNNVKENKKLDEKTMDEMIRRYMNVHDKMLEILYNKGE